MLVTLNGLKYEITGIVDGRVKLQLIEKTKSVFARTNPSFKIHFDKTHGYHIKLPTETWKEYKIIEVESIMKNVFKRYL